MVLEDTTADSIKKELMRNPMLILFLLIMLTSVGGTVKAFAQVQGSAFSNNYEYRDDLFESKEGQLETIWRARIYGESTALETQSAQVGGFDLFAETKYQMLETLEARVFMRGKFESGRSQSFFGDIEPANAILVREAAVKYQPADFFNFKAGVINQDWLDMPLLVYRQSFPGANAELSYGITEEMRVGAISQYTIPTSQTLSPRTVGAEATPTFVTQTLYAKWSDRSLNASVTANLYEYNNLPSFVAFQSQLYGNTFYVGDPGSPIFTGPNNSRFNYEFKGWFTTAGGSYRVNALLEPHAYVNVIKNTEAPETFNDGQIFGLGTKFHTNDYIISAAYENFFAESDVAPSFYNAWALGNTNRQGDGFDLWIQFKKKNFRLRAQYYRADVINSNQNIQENQQYFYLGVETGYDKI
jgi:hypothetical protein